MMYVTNCFLGAGSGNLISSGSFNSFIGAGFSNQVSGSGSSILGGSGNKTSGNYSSIVGGANHSSSGNYSFIGGGTGHRLTGDYSSIVGGRMAFVSGHSGAGVWADGQDRNHTSKGNHTCSLDFASGVYLTLPKFTGLSSQSGNIGQLAVSGGFLYICTGTSANFWGRIPISGFT
jgi:hypothetical protein